MAPLSGGGSGGITSGGGAGGAGGTSPCNRCDASPGDAVTGSGGLLGMDASNLGGAGGGAGGRDGATDVGSVGAMCPGTEPPPSDRPLCRALQDCPSGYDSCQQSLPTPDTSGCRPIPCTIPGAGPSRACSADGDCGAGKVCISKPYPCCSLLEYDCVAACTSTSCAAGERCAPSGHCELQPCTDGFACAAGTTCAPTRAGADTHGCAPIQCADGYACPADTRCQAGASRADAHGCVPVLCTEGYTCKDNLGCMSTSGGADSHGCAPVSCTGVTCPVNQMCKLTVGVSASCTAKPCKADGDCDCGVCLNPGPNGTCAPRMSICVTRGYGGAVGASGGSYGGGGGVTGTGGAVIDGGMGGAGGHAIDGASSSSERG